MGAASTIILDGGMGRELQRAGAPFRQPEWSALALSEAPQAVEAVHAAYIASGANVITSNSYAVVPFHIGEERFAAEGQALAALAGELARRAVQASGKAVRVAGSLPPLFGSYRPDLFEASRVTELLGPLVKGLAPHVDLWLAETQSSIVEARAIHAGLAAGRQAVLAVVHPEGRRHRRSAAFAFRRAGGRSGCSGGCSWASRRCCSTAASRK